MKHSFWKNVDVHEKGTSNNNIVLNKVQTTGKSKLSFDEQKKQSLISVLQNSCYWQPFFCSSISAQRCHYEETSLLISCTNQRTGFYITETLC